MRRILDLTLIATIALLAYFTWLGQQRPEDRYLQAVQARGVLRVGLDPTYPPFDLVSDGKVGGYDATLARALASDLGVHVEFQTLALDTLYDALEAGKVDLLLSALPPIPERLDKVRYSTPYYQSGLVLLVRAGDSRIASVQALKEKRVGVEKGSAADTEARRISREAVKGMQVRSIYHSPAEALQAVATGEIDAAITDGVSAQTYLQNHPGLLMVVPPTLTDEPYVVALPSQAPALAASVDGTIARLRASGDLDRIMGGTLK